MLILPVVSAALLCWGCQAQPSGEGQIQLPVIGKAKPAAAPSRDVEASTAPAPSDVSAVANRAEPAAAPAKTAPVAATVPAKPLPILVPESADTPPVEPAGDGQSAVQRGEKLAVVNTIVARINDEIITREDILRDLRGSMAQWKEKLSPREFEARVRIEGRTRLKAEISMRLLLAEARRQYSDDNQKEALKKELDKQWQRMVAQYGGSEAALRDDLAKGGYTEASWRKRQEELMLVQIFLSEHLEPRVAVTHDEMLAYYESVKAERYVVKAMEHVLLIKLEQKDFADAKAMQSLAASLAARIRGGEDFGKLAKQFSRAAKAAEGGDWGLMERGSHRVETLNEAQATLPVGGVSEPIVDGQDAYIIKVADRQVARTIPFTEVQQECRAAVVRSKRDEMVNDYVKSLYGKNFVEVHEENL
jgi:parvulin-like peptidyl-prolyl isomerase